MNTTDVGRFTFFFPGARILSQDEVASLPSEKKQAAEAANQEGVWIEIDCPDGTCVDRDGKIKIPAAGVQGAGKKGIWLNLFCPEDSCQIRESTDLA
ncbi:MAG: hypothetical protein K9L59_10615 [Desulfobacterales bacterium]|nr:hypothetical protein [Desulfobacterales bacterium]